MESGWAKTGARELEKGREGRDGKVGGDKKSANKGIVIPHFCTIYSGLLFFLNFFF